MMNNHLNILRKTPMRLSKLDEIALVGGHF